MPRLRLAVLLAAMLMLARRADDPRLRGFPAPRQRLLDLVARRRHLLAAPE